MNQDPNPIQTMEINKNRCKNELFEFARIVLLNGRLSAETWDSKNLYFKVKIQNDDPYRPSSRFFLATRSNYSGIRNSNKPAVLKSDFASCQSRLVSLVDQQDVTRPILQPIAAIAYGKVK